MDNIAIFDSKIIAGQIKSYQFELNTLIGFEKFFIGNCFDHRKKSRITKLTQ